VQIIVSIVVMNGLVKVAKDLTEWYLKNRRDLPWRQTKDPYCIWISEVILQQTRVNQGINYYYRFIEHFPNVTSLANANIDEVLKFWQGLGYYSRARNLHIAAKQILNEYNGEFPKEVEKLLLLKGIGNYTASAIASIAFDVAVPVVDGNVYRVLSRYFCIDSPIGTNKAYTIYYKEAKKLMGNLNPSIFNQALMELGALVCTNKNPDCDFCPIASSCKALKNDVRELLPVNNKKIITKDRYFNYFVIVSGNQIVMHKRLENDIWHSLYDFPLIETIEEEDIKKVIEIGQNKFLINEKGISIVSTSKLLKHKLTHQTIYVTFIKIELEKISLKLNLKFKIFNLTQLNQLPVPKVIEKYIADEFDIKK
jgi:A/G-specific adenine glycosylase